MPGITVIKPPLFRYQQLLWLGSRAPHSWALAALAAVEAILGSVPALSACRTHASTLSLLLSLCIYACRLDSSPFWRLAGGFPAGSCCLPVPFSSHPISPTTVWGRCLPPWKSSPAQLTSLQQAEPTCPLPCLYVSLAGIQPRLPGLLNALLSIIWEYSRLWWSC